MLISKHIIQQFISNKLTVLISYGISNTDDKTSKNFGQAIWVEKSNVLWFSQIILIFLYAKHSHTYITKNT